MITETFNPMYQTCTPKGDLNFIGAVIRYFEKYTHNCSDETKNTYIRDYNERIFPIIKPGIPVTEYDESAINSLLEILRRNYAYSDATIVSRYQHLFTEPFDEYYNDVSTANPFWGAGYRFSEKNSENIGSALLKIPKSLDKKQELKATKILFSNPNTDNGVRIGLALMLSCGVRNNEAAGLNFGDLIELSDHPGYFVLRVVRSSHYNSNRRKIGGKTRNAARIIPLTKRFSDFLLARIAYISTQINFPYEDRHGVIESVADLPIACRRNEYTVPCSAVDLTIEGRTLLRDDLKVQEQDYAGISYMIQHGYETEEKDATTYLLRRNYATHLYTLGFPLEWRQYLMGHLIEDEILKRWDFNDEEYLFKMAKLLERHPFSNVLPELRVYKLSGGESVKSYHITISNLELNDPIHLHMTGQEYTAVITSVKTAMDFPVEIDISRIVNQY